MAYFSFKKIGSLVILPMIVLASITAEAHAAPKVRVLSQSQRGKLLRGNRFQRMQLTTSTECNDALVSATTQYNHGSAGEARQAGIKKWENKAYMANTKPGSISWNWAASKSIQTRSKETYIPNHGWNGNGVGSVQTVWQATVKGIPCGQYASNPPAIP